MIINQKTSVSYLGVTHEIALDDRDIDKPFIKESNENIAQFITVN